MLSHTCKLSAFALGTAMAFGVAAMGADLPTRVCKLPSNSFAQPHETAQAMSATGWGVRPVDPRGSLRAHLSRWCC